MIRRHFSLRVAEFVRIPSAHLLHSPELYSVRPQRRVSQRVSTEPVSVGALYRLNVSKKSAGSRYGVGPLMRRLNCLGMKPPRW